MLRAPRSGSTEALVLSDPPLRLPLQEVVGENTYAVLRAPRSGSTEALVLSVTYQSPASGAALALLLSLANYWKRE